MIQRLLFSILTILAMSLAVPLSAFGQLQIDSRIIDKKVELETKLSDRLRERIATSVDRKFFEIAVQLAVEQYDPPEKSKKEREGDNEDLELKKKVPSADLSLGLLDTEKMLRDFKIQLKSLEESKRTIIQTTDENRLFFRIKSASMECGRFVGIEGAII